MLSLRFHFKEPVILSFCATVGLHLIFLIGIIVFMTEEYYTVGSRGRHHHKHRHHAQLVHGRNLQAAQPAPYQPIIPELDERFVTRDEESNTYRLSPDLVKAFKSLDIAPIIQKNTKHERKPNNIKKEKPQLQRNPKNKATQQKQITTPKLKPSKPEKKISIQAPTVHGKTAEPHIAPTSARSTHKKNTAQITAPPQHTLQNNTAAPAKQIKIQQQTMHHDNINEAAATSTVQTPTTPTPTPRHSTQPERTTEVPVEYDEPDASAALPTDYDDDTDTYDDDDDGTEEQGNGSIIDTDTLSLAAANARGGILSAQQNQAAKQLSDHVVKQWKPPAGCHDATPVHVEVTVQHDGAVMSKIVKPSSLPILNFAVKRMVAQFSTKHVQEMLEHARGAKLILIFKG